MRSLTAEDVERAADRIAPHVLRTPMIAAEGRLAGRAAPLHLKLEQLQPTGSFKLRGATNAVLQLSAAQRRAGVVTASSGNHGPALARAASRLGVRCVVCLSQMVPANKVDNVRRNGGEARIAGKDYDEAVAESKRLECKHGLVRVHAFDDPGVIAGAGTVAREILEDLADARTILVPLSGGGLLGGMALYAKARAPRVRIVGVSMARGASMIESLRAGGPVEISEEPTIADALGGNIGLDNRWTLALVRDLVDEVMTVSEEDIARAMRVLFEDQGLVVEGAGAVGVAALLAGTSPAPDGPAVAVLTGRNVAPDRHRSVICGA